MAHPKTKAGEARLNILRAAREPENTDDLKQAIFDFREAILDEAALDRSELYEALWVWGELHHNQCFACFHGVDHNPSRWLSTMLDMSIDLDDSND